MNAKTMLIGGLIVLIAADLALATLPGVAGTFAAIALWGVHMAATQGLFAKLVADRSAPELRGPAYGVFNLSTGLSLLAASLIAGVASDTVGPSATFLTGAAFAVAALLGLAFVRTSESLG